MKPHEERERPMIDRTRKARLVLLALAMALWGASPGTATTPDAESPVADPRLALGAAPGAEIQWASSFEHALEQAEILRQPIMIDVWARWCRWCHELDKKTYSHPEVIERAQLMTCSKVNSDREPGLSRQLRISGLPTILFFDRHGQEIDRVRGFVQASPFAVYMDDVLAASDRTELLAAELREDPADPSRIYALADELLAHERYTEAEPLLASLSPVGRRQGSAHEADAVLDIALLRQKSGDQAAARDILIAFLDAYPDSRRRLEAELYLGQALLLLGEHGEAVDHLDSVISGDSASWKASEAQRLTALIEIENGRAEAGQ
jgi:thioredoxin-like negative regulator of GroEL